MVSSIKKLSLSAGVILPMLATRALAANSDIEQGANYAGQSAGLNGDLPAQITAITNTLLLVIGVAAVLMLIVGGFRYVFSQGNEKAISAAKDTILYAVIGIVVAIMSYAIVNFVIGRF